MTVKHVFHRICLLLSVFFLFGIVTVPVRAEENESKKELKMKTTSLVMIGDSSHKLKLSKTNITGQVVWKSSNPKIAAVNSKGKVKAKKKGKVTITAEADGCLATCKIKVITAQLSAADLTLNRGKSKTLKVIGTSKKVTWKSSDPTVATVSSKGKVKAKKKGTAKITAAIGASTLTCKVTVNTTKWDDILDSYQNDDSINQLLFVKYTGGSKAKVILYNKDNGKWKKILSCSGEVGKNGIDKQREGDKKTPTGIFNLTHGFGIKKNPGTKVPYVKVNSNLYWCGDQNYYNQLIDITEKPHHCTGEHLIDYTQCYAYGMFLDYNKECIPGKGSAIFLHCKGNSGYTAGCVAVSQENMIKILRSVEPGAKICIYPL